PNRTLGDGYVGSSCEVDSLWLIREYAARGSGDPDPRFTMSTITEEVVQQRRYYASAASAYDAQHLRDDGIHEFALAFLGGVVEHLQVRTLLDVGSGTGRVLRHFKAQRPDIDAIGIEPVEELRAVGYRHGLDETQLID